MLSLVTVVHITSFIRSPCLYYTSIIARYIIEEAVGQSKATKHEFTS